MNIQDNILAYNQCCPVQGNNVDLIIKYDYIVTFILAICPTAMPIEPAALLTKTVSPAFG